jgi:uncharacterized protein involved in outer membrane biogenesis
MARESNLHYFICMRRALAIVAVALVLLAGLAVLGVEALAGGAGKDRIAAALSRALGLPVTIGQLSISLFPTPALAAGHVQIGANESGVSVQTLRVVPDLWSFLPTHTKTIQRVDLIGLTIQAGRDASGLWRFPIPPTQGVSQANGKGAGKGGSGGNLNLNALRIRDGAIHVVDDSLHTNSTISAVSADIAMQNGVITAPDFTGQVGSTVVKGSARYGPSGVALRLSSSSIGNADLPALFALAGLRPYPGLSIEGRAPFEMTTQVGSDLHSLSVTGKTDIEHLRLSSIVLDSVHAPFRLDKKIFTLDPMRFGVYGGHEQGHVEIDMAQATPVYAIGTTITGLDVNRALSATTTMGGKLTGTARVTTNVRASGTTQEAIERSLTGTVAFGVAKGIVKNFAILSAINQALGAAGEASRDVAFDSLTGTATIGGARAETKDLTLRAGDLTMTGQGTYGFDQSLNLKTITQLSAARTRDLAQRVALVQRLETQQGELAIPVTVTGTASAPKFGVDVGTLAKQHLPGALIQQGLQKLLPH